MFGDRASDQPVPSAARRNKHRNFRQNCFAALDRFATNGSVEQTTGIHPGFELLIIAGKIRSEDCIFEIIELCAQAQAMASAKQFGGKRNRSEEHTSELSHGYI